MDIVWFVVVGIAAGWIAGVVMKGSGLGLVGNLVVGVVGALVGGLLFRALGISIGGGILGAIAVAAIGAIVLLAFVRLVKRIERLGAPIRALTAARTGRRRSRACRARS